MVTPIRPTDDEARSLAQSLIRDAQFGALAVHEPDTGAPMVTRVALGTDPAGGLVSLVSELSLHTQALRAHATCSVLVGEPGDKGDPLTHPRLTVQAVAQFVAHSDENYEKLAAHYLRDHPKAKLYIQFTDFHFLLFKPVKAYLNGGFGKAFHLDAQDLIPG